MKTKTEFLRVAEAAELLSVAPNTVRAWGASGKLPEYRHPANNFRLFKRSDIERMLREIEGSLASPRKVKRKPR